MPIIVLSILVQLALVVHIIKTGRSTTWVFIVLFFPLIGSLAYFIIELLPELGNSRVARTAQRNLSNAINPEKELRNALEQFAVANTVQNAMTLADLHIQHGNFLEAQELYKRTLSGVHADDPGLLLGLANAHFGLGEYNDSLKCLDTLKEKHPDRTSPEGHLLYARALSESGRIQEAIKEFDSLIAYYPGPEPTCRLALIRIEQGDLGQAAELFQGVLKTAKTSGKHYNQINKEWISLARRETHS